MTDHQLGVVIPTLNSAATLDWTLCALRAQRGCSVHVIVADSGSEDGTLEICKRWGVETTDVPPGNMYRAVNQGLNLMGTEWVTYLNSDDLVYPYSYARMLAQGTRDVALVYGNCDYVDEEGRFLFTWQAAHPLSLPGIFRRSIQGFSQPSAIFRKRVFHELGGFDEKYRHIGDYDFFYRVALSGYVLVRLPLPSVAAFRVHKSQLSTRELHFVDEERKAHRKAHGSSAWREDLFVLLPWRLANTPNYLIRFLNTRTLR